MTKNGSVLFSLWICIAFSSAAGCSEDTDKSQEGSEQEGSDTGGDGDADADGDADTDADTDTDADADSDADADTDTDTDGDADADTDSDSDADTDADTAGADVCNYSGEPALGAAEGDGMVRVSPDHPYINYFGRVNCTDPAAPSFAFPGVSIRAKFDADTIDMVLNDHGSSRHPNFYNIIIDDGEPAVLEAAPGENTYNLAENLAVGEHTVEIFKRVESNGGPGQAEFLGFRIPEGASVLPILPRPYRLEVIGDSITCGYGDEVSVTDPSGYGYTTENSNAYKAWAAVAARDLDAEYMAVAYSGRGIYRNYGDDAGATMPEMYLDTLPEDDTAAEWNIAQYTPEVVAINLGTNDFSPGIDTANLEAARQEFELTYLEFVETLRGYYPMATFVLAVGPMLSDDYPSGYSARTGVVDAVSAVISARAADGDTKLHLLDLGTQSAPYGEDWHPTAATQAAMAGALVDLIDELELM